MKCSGWSVEWSALFGGPIHRQGLFLDLRRCQSNFTSSSPYAISHTPAPAHFLATSHRPRATLLRISRELLSADSRSDLLCRHCESLAVSCPSAILSDPSGFLSRLLLAYSRQPRPATTATALLYLSRHYSTTFPCNIALSLVRSS